MPSSGCRRELSAVHRRSRSARSWPTGCRTRAREGPAGVGKTEFARALAAATGRQLIRLQCYEGLDEDQGALRVGVRQAAPLHSAAQGTRSPRPSPARTPCARRPIASRAAKTSSQRAVPPAAAGAAAPSPARSRPCCWSTRSTKADPEFEAFLLEVLADFAVTVPESRHHPRSPRAARGPDVERLPELSDGLKRRCLQPLHRLPFAGRASWPSCARACRA